MKYYIKKHTKAQLCHHRRKKAECCNVSLEVVDPVVPRAYDLLIAPWYVYQDYGYDGRTTYVNVGPIDDINVGDQVVDAYNVISPHDFILNRFDENRDQLTPLDKYQDVSNITWTWDYNDELGNQSLSRPPYNTIPTALDVIREQSITFYADVAYSVSETVPLGHTISTDTNTWQPFTQIPIDNQPTICINWERIVQDQKRIFLTLNCEVQFTDPDSEDPMEVLTATARLPYVFAWDNGPQQPPSNLIAKPYHMEVSVEPDIANVVDIVDKQINPFREKNHEPYIEFGEYEINEGVIELGDNALTERFVIKNEIDADPESYDLELVEVTEYRGTLPNNKLKPDEAVLPEAQPGYSGMPWNTQSYVKGVNDTDLTLFKLTGLSTLADNLNGPPAYDWSCFKFRFKGRVNQRFFDTTFVHYYYVDV
nr:hypothetical protein [Cressdnaviricota sp.]